MSRSRLVLPVLLLVSWALIVFKVVNVNVNVAAANSTNRHKHRHKHRHRYSPSIGLTLQVKDAGSFVGGSSALEPIVSFQDTWLSDDLLTRASVSATT
jgi:hypothetical protein